MKKVLLLLVAVLGINTMVGQEVFKLKIMSTTFNPAMRIKGKVTYDDHVLTIDFKNKKMGVMSLDLKVFMDMEDTEVVEQLLVGERILMITSPQFRTHLSIKEEGNSSFMQEWKDKFTGQVHTIQYIFAHFKK